MIDDFGYLIQNNVLSHIQEQRGKPTAEAPALGSKLMAIIGKKAIQPQSLKLAKWGKDSNSKREFFVQRPSSSAGIRRFLRLGTFKHHGCTPRQCQGTLRFEGLFRVLKK